MKKLVLLTAGALITTTSFSQVSIDPEIGLNISNIRAKLGDNDAKSTDSKLGLSAGVGVNFGITKNVYLRPGLYYHNLGGENETSLSKSTTNFHYLRVPVNIGYNYTISDNAGAIFAEAGPYVGFALAGQDKTEALGITTKNDVKYGSGITETNAFDWGFNFGLGYETPWGVYVKGSYGLGLGNMSNVDNFTLTNNHFNVALGYKINL